jgi:hypothetical protein
MADSFDPYHKWLGISPKDQPPNHYRLLAIELFERDADVIEGAADRVMGHLRTFQAGLHSAHSQRLLNECAAARVTLLDPQKRAEYDRQLRQKLAGSAGAPRPSGEGRDEQTAPRARPQPGVSPQPVISPQPGPVAKPLPQAAPLPVVVPASVAREENAATSIHRRLARKTPLWRQPAVLGTVGAIVIFAGVAYALTRGGKLPTDSTPNTVKDTPTAPANPQAPVSPPAENRSTGPAVAGPTVQPPVSSQADFEILSATWGVNDKWVDVTEGIRGLVKDNRLMMIVGSDLFGKPDDPAPGVGKKLRIRHRSRGKEYTAEYFDSWFVYLDGNSLAPPTDSPGSLELLEARYGAGGIFLDVLPQLAPRAAGGRLSVAADEFAATAAAELEKNGIGQNKDKVLWVRYRNQTGEHFDYAWNSRLLTVDTRLPPAAGRPVDLLKLIEVPRHVVHGDWSMKDGKLLAPSQGLAARVLIPYRVPSDYALNVVVESDGQLADLGAGLVVGGHQVVAMIDTGTELWLSGMSMVNGMWHSDDRNPSKTWRLARMLEQGRPNTLTYIVRPTSVRLLRDGAEIVRWSGDPGTFSVAETWQVSDPHRLFLHSYHSPYRITKVELTPLAPETTPVLALDESGLPVDVLKSIDLDRDRVHGDWQYDGQALVSPADESGARLRLPAIVPDSYQLDLVAQRESGNGLMLTVPVAGTVGTLFLDGYEGKISGLQKIDDQLIDKNETRYDGSIFDDGNRHLVRLTVQKNHVRLVCDGKPIVDWTGDINRLKSTESFPYHDRIYLGSWQSRYRLTQIKLRALRGDEPDEPSPSLAGEPPRNLAPLVEPVSPKPPEPDRKFSDLASGKETRLPVPDDEAQKEARKEMQKKLGNSLKGARSPEQRRALSRELAQKAATETNTAYAYVLLKQAIDLAQAAGEIELAWQTVDQLAKTFAVDGMALRSQSLAEIGKVARSPDAAWWLTDAACRLTIASLLAGDAATVKKAASQAQGFAKRTGDRALQKDVNGRASDAGKLAAELEAVAAARETLKTLPDDPEANFALGHFELCAGGNFDAALPKLAKGSDEGWKKLAADELDLDNRQGRTPVFANGRRVIRTEGDDAERALAVADAWWSRAEEEPWPATHYLRMRAARWYVPAYRSLVDADARARAAGRLKLLLAIDDGFPHWELFNGRGPGEAEGEVLRLERGSALQTAVEYTGALDVTVVVRTTGTDFRLGSHNWSWGWNFKIVPNVWHTLRFVITPVSRTAFVDGVPLDNDAWKTPRTLNSAPVSVYMTGDEIAEIKKFIVQSTD